MFYKILLNFFFSLSIHRYVLFISMTTFCFQTNVAYSQTEDDEYEDDEYDYDEYEDDDYEDDEYEDDEYEDDEYEDDEYKKKSNVKKGFTMGINSSLGFISGEAFTNIPYGGTIIFSTPYGFQIAGVQINFSGALGQYNGSYTPTSNVPVGEYDPNLGNYPSTSFKPNIIGIGYDFTLSNVLYLEGHPSIIGKGFGYRGFMGLSFENFIYNLNIQLKKKGEDLFSSDIALPFNILVGLEGFITSDTGYGNASYWGGVGIRIDYNFKSGP